MICYYESVDTGLHVLDAIRQTYTYQLMIFCFY